MIIIRNLKNEVSKVLKLEIEEKDGKLVVSSRVIAKELKKEHRNVMRDLEKILKGMLKCEHTPENLIIPSTYINEQNKQEYKEYLLTKDRSSEVSHEIAKRVFTYHF